MNLRLKDVLEPVSGHLPCGEDLSFSAEFDRIQEARREDDPTVDYGEWKTTLKQADWATVINCCNELLQARSKDLRLAGWLTEGLVKTRGLAGLAEGAEIMASLITHFGMHIYPQPEEGDQEQRIGMLSWFVMRMSQLVRQTPITHGKAGQFNLNDYESALHLQAQLQRNGDSATDLDNKITLDRFSAAVVKTDKALYIKWIEDVEHCRAAMNKLMEASDVLFGAEGPSFSPLTNSIEAVHQRLQSIAKESGMQSVTKTPIQEEGVHAIEGQPDKLHPVALNSAIQTREQALEILRQVALFFRNTEPHSPVAYLAEKAVHWGTMPLHLWLRTVVKDHGALSHIEELLGLELEAGKGHSNE